MAKITEEQQTIIDSFKVIRAKDLEDKSILYKVKGPIKDGKEQRKIIDLFIDSLEEDEEGNLASFVVMTEDEYPLLLFSLRCGDLFRKNDAQDIQLMQLGHDAYLALKKIGDTNTSKEDRSNAINVLIQADSAGLQFDDIVRLYSKKKDVRLETTSDLTRVLESYPAIELKLLAANVSARDYWDSLPMPKEKRMGEVLFWTKVIETIERALAVVGCQYLYLFAADKSEGTLVQYYRHILNFGSDKEISANKPFFDYNCLFLYQSMTELKKKCQSFTENFNPDPKKEQEG